MNLDKVYAESIAKEYAAKEASKLTALKKLDNKAKQPARVFAWTFGTVATLMLGLGMCLAMQVLGKGTLIMGIGIIIGLVGIAGVSVNYAIYKKLLAQGKQKYAFEIMELAKQISAEEE